jgi:glutathionylspermidine synthase
VVEMSLPWEVVGSLQPPSHDEFRRRAIFECGKWDPQSGDVSALAPFPIVLSQTAWQSVSRSAVALYQETLALETAVLKRPERWRQLGIPRSIRSALRGAAPNRDDLRFMRFDYHWTTDGWRISEVNSDVPGGFIESSGISRLMAAQYSGLAPVGDPTNTLVDRLAERLGDESNVGLVHATAYTDDRQVMRHLAEAMIKKGQAAHLLSPVDLSWRNGVASATVHGKNHRIDTIIRFFPAEWLKNLPSWSGWRWLFAGSLVPQCNPGAALLTQSKRLPFCWDKCGVRIEEWKRMLPETRDPRSVDWRSGEWVLKPALGRVGDGVGMLGVSSAREWRRIGWWAKVRPSQWVAQRRFSAVAMETDRGLVYPCVGVFVVDGTVCGAYGRTAARPLIDDKAQDAPVLVRMETVTRATTFEGSARHAAA